MTIQNLLDQNEKAVLLTLKELKGPIGEDEYHIIHKILDDSGMGLGLEYEFVYWEKINKDFKSGLGGVLYSSKLHNIINNLVNKGFIERNKKNLIEIRYCND